MKNSDLLKFIAGVLAALVLILIAFSCSNPCIDCQTTYTDTSNGRVTKNEYFTFCGNTKEYREMITTGNRQDFFNGQIQQVETVCEKY